MKRTKADTSNNYLFIISEDIINYLSKKGKNFFKKMLILKAKFESFVIILKKI